MDIRLDFNKCVTRFGLIGLSLPKSTYELEHEHTIKVRYLEDIVNQCLKKTKSCMFCLHLYTKKMINVTLLLIFDINL